MSKILVVVTILVSSLAAFPVLAEVDINSEVKNLEQNINNASGDAEPLPPTSSPSAPETETKATKNVDSSASAQRSLQNLKQAIETE